MKRYRSFFILGNPRSGTSLLRAMLNNHNKISIAPECGFIQWWNEKYGDWNAEDSTDEDRISAYLKDLSSSRKIETWDLNFEYLHDLIYEIQPENYRELSQTVQLQYALKYDKSPEIFGDKNNYYIKHLAGIKSIFSQAKFLGIIRDGRDVACSYLKLNNLETDSPYKPDLPSSIKEIASEWVKNNELIINFSEELDIDQFCWIKYEDLILKPQESLLKISNFLDVAYDEDMLLYHEKNSEPTETLDWKKKTRQKPDKSNIGKYNSELEPSEIEIFNRLSEDMLKKFSYL